MLARARGFIYYVAVTGVTGVRAALPADLSDMVRRIRAISPVPVGVGFGISSAEHAVQVAGVADAAIVGSALSQVIEQSLGQPDLVPRVGALVAELKTALRSSAPATPNDTGATSAPPRS